MHRVSTRIERILLFVAMIRVNTCIKRVLPFITMLRIVQDAKHRVSTRIKPNNA